MVFITLFLVLCGDLVENELQPKQAKSIEIIHEFTLGDGSKEDLFFSEAVTTVATDTHIFALDPANFRVIIFDIQGQMLKEFGKQGQGPGEFQGAIAMAIDTQGNLAIFDTLQKRLSFFDMDGNHLRDMKLDPGIQHISTPYFLPNGQAVFMSVRTDAQFQMTYDLSVYDSEMSVVKQLQSQPLPPSDWSQAGEPSFWVDFLKNQFEAITAGFPLTATLGQTGLYAAGTSSAYHVDIYSHSSEKVIRFNKKFQPKGFSQDAQYQYCESVWEDLTANAFLAPNLPRPVFEKAQSQANLPDFLPPVFAMVNLGNGLAVFTNYDIVGQKGTVDYFDSNGVCKATGAYSGPLKSAFGHKDKIYSVGLNEEDTIVIKAYRVKGLPL